MLAWVGSGGDLIQARWAMLLVPLGFGCWAIRECSAKSARVGPKIFHKNPACHSNQIAIDSPCQCAHGASWNRHRCISVQTCNTGVLPFVQRSLRRRPNIAALKHSSCRLLSNSQPHLEHIARLGNPFDWVDWVEKIQLSGVLQVHVPKTFNLDRVSLLVCACNSATLKHSPPFSYPSSLKTNFLCL